MSKSAYIKSCESIGLHVVRLRGFYGLTQDFLADRSGLSRATIARVEGGKHVEEESIEKIAEVFGLKAEDLKTKDTKALIGDSRLPGV